MDNQTLITASITSAFTVIVGILYKIYLIVNHKRIHSVCCNKICDTSIDIENTTPNPPVIDVDVDSTNH
jgi:hypothetical protein